MSCHFDVHMSPEPGALQRLLGIVRRRGFTVTSLNAVRDIAGHNYHLDLVVEGSRCPSTLRKHLSNIADVRAVNMLTPMPRTSCA